MNPARKRRIRLTVALTAAILLASGLVYTSFSAGSQAKTPSDLLAGAEQGRSYQLTGKVADGSVKREGDVLHFKVRDREGTAAVPVSYTGAVPDPFREGREVIVTVKAGSGGTFVGEHDSLITKCPSKFTAEKTTPS
jgi:cytochrome c-type biogenesis protein CcmE